MGHGYKNPIYTDIYSVASFVPFFTKFIYVSAGKVERTKLMGGRGTRQKYRKKRQGTGI
jgi:hypothetical protein